jgi:lysophospholipase L1-like esterase
MAIDRSKVYQLLWLPAIWVLFVSLRTITAGSKTAENKTKSNSIRGKKLLFLGDSHTVPSNGWVEALTINAGADSFDKRAANGKTTEWMLTQLKTYLAYHRPSFVIVWGGANDAYGNIPQSKTIANMQSIIDVANNKGARVIFVTGYDPSKVSYNFDTKYLYGTQQSLTAGKNNLLALISAMPKKLKGDFIVIPPNSSFTRANSTDGLHLTMGAYQQYGRWLAEKYLGG